MSNLPRAKNETTKKEKPTISMEPYYSSKYKGRFSCYLFLEDLYNKEYGIDISFLEGLSAKDSNIKVKKQALDVIKKHWVAIKKLKVGDIAILDVDPVHIMVYIGNDYFAHSDDPMPVSIKKIKDINRHRILGLYRYKGKE